MSLWSGLKVMRQCSAGQHRHSTPPSPSSRRSPPATGISWASGTPKRRRTLMASPLATTLAPVRLAMTSAPGRWSKWACEMKMKSQTSTSSSLPTTGRLSGRLSQVSRKMTRPCSLSRNVVAPTAVHAQLLLPTRRDASTPRTPLNGHRTCARGGHVGQVDALAQACAASRATRKQTSGDSEFSSRWRERPRAQLWARATVTKLAQLVGRASSAGRLLQVSCSFLGRAREARRELGSAALQGLVQLARHPRVLESSLKQRRGPMARFERVGNAKGDA